MLPFKVNPHYVLIAFVLLVQCFSKNVSSISVTNERYRLNYHVMAPVGWINDPNGFSYFNGEYHLFYQYNPYNVTTGNIHWGHVSSSDLVHWKHLPIALYPDQQYDLGGVFSGSGIVVNNSLVLMYTGNVGSANGSYFSSQSQNLAFSTDGLTFNKYANNPVIAFPPVNGGEAFRDPKVWVHNNRYYVVLGNQNNTTSQGRVVLYRSDNLLRWEYVGVLGESDGTQGFMWECPDFFELDGRFILLPSPQGINRTGNDFANLYQTGYFVGSFDYTTNYFNYTSSSFIELDHGHDFYATQTMRTLTGRRILIAWMGMWESNFQEQEDGWAGAMTVPRELTLSSSGRILQSPISELESLRKSTLLSTSLHLVPGLNRLFESSSAEIQIAATFNRSVVTFGLFIDLGNGSYVSAYLNNSNSNFVLDRGDNDPRITSVNINTTGNSQFLRMRVYLDKSSIEIFLDDGEVTFTSRIYPRSTPIVYALSSGSDSRADVVAYELENIWSGSSSNILRYSVQNFIYVFSVAVILTLKSS